jgi:glycosyltransferase involved in cell wall biosynthesis
VKIALVPGSCYEDATMRSVLSGLSRARKALIFSPPAPRASSLRFETAKKVERFSSVAQLSRLVRERKVGLVHLHFSGRLRPWMRGLAEFGAVKLVVTFQDFEHPELPRNSAADLRILRKILARAHAVTAVSDFLGAKVSRSFKCEVKTVPNGFNPTKASPARSRRPYILSVGRLAPYKGTDLLLMAYAGIPEPKPELILCGAPFDRRISAGLIKALRLEKRVRLTGLREPGEVARLMKGCLFYAAAPRAETFGMALVEAMASGKAVLATRTGGIPEFAIDGKNALVVPPKNIEALARALRRLIENPALRSRLGRAARETASRFTWERAAAAYLSVSRTRRPLAKSSRN